MKTIDDFDHIYNQDTSVLSDNFDNDGRLETFGEDKQRAILIELNAPRKVWSCMNDEKGNGRNILFVTGLIQDAIYYIITKEEWKDENEVYTLELPTI